MARLKSTDVKPRDPKWDKWDREMMRRNGMVTNDTKTFQEQSKTYGFKGEKPYAK